MWYREVTVNGVVEVRETGLPLRDRDFEERWRLQTQVGEMNVSTVFLALDHSFGDTEGPVLYETMVFRGDSMSEEHCERYRTRAQAEHGHRDWVRYLEESMARELTVSAPVERPGRRRGIEL